MPGWPASTCASRPTVTIASWMGRISPRGLAEIISGKIARPSTRERSRTLSSSTAHSGKLRLRRLHAGILATLALYANAIVLGSCDQKSCDRRTFERLINYLLVRGISPVFGQ